MQPSLPLPALPEPAPWFTRALANPGESHHVMVHGARLHYRCWSMEHDERPVLMLLHGFRAHARWWDFIAPFFAASYRVIAPDFSGMGDSAWRASYGADTFAADITGLIDALNIGPVTAAGHSYGGSRLLRACAARPDLFNRALVIDSFILFENEPGPALRKLLGSRSYPDFASARTRYRLMPDQDNALPYLVDYIASHALREVEDGWRWKFDPGMPATGYREQDGAALLNSIAVPVDFIHAEHSTVVSAERAARTVTHLRDGRGPVTIPHGQHHLMLDQPLALVGAMRALLANQPSLSTTSSRTPK
ncbi:MAG: alpha/beta hydrolase [Pseudomonadota bacterium]